MVRIDPKPKKRTIRSLFSIAALLLGTTGLWAVEPATPLAELSRQSWVLENGLPQNTVQALAQTSDGFIWLGTEVGLVRFDGTSFQVFDRSSAPAMPGNDIRCLLGAEDGSLWIGTNRGLARWKNGAVTVFTTKDGLPGDGILAVGEDGNGRLLVWTEAGLAEQTGERFAQVKNADAFPRTTLSSPDENPGAVEFEQKMPDGMAVRGDRSSLKLVAASKAPGKPPGKAPGGGTRLTVGRELPGSRIQAVLADRQGTLWIGTNSGLVRWVRGKVESFPVTDPLATASILALFEDREGDVWVGTETDGLGILRDRRFVTFGAREGLASDATTTVVEGGAGTLWVGTSGSGLEAIRLGEDGTGDEVFPKKEGIRTYTVEDGLASNVILSLAAAPNGDVWVGTPDGLNRIRRGRIETFSSADGLPDDFIRSLLVDADGSLWIGTRRGLAHWASGSGGPNGTGASPKFVTYTEENGLGSDLVGAMARDADGNLWIATLAGLSRLRNGKISNFTIANGLSSNVVTALLARPDGTLLIGTEGHGLNLWDGRRFLRMTNNSLNSLDRATIHAILDDGEGHLWFATGNGIARCDCGGMSRANGAAGCSHWMEFGTADGLRSREMATNSHPSAWRSLDGRLWFATPKGLVEVNPAHFPINRLPPPVALERFAVDDVAHALGGAGSRIRVEAGHVHFEFDYAGLSFVAPQKVRYRYILEGFDRGWTDAGPRRSAYYTNIPPGRYTFRVQAANNDGVWNTAGAALNFELEPHYYQTAWFWALLLAALTALTLLLLRRRLRVAEREFRAVLG
ncbi:MAG: ligand-binding sensor domain-containing protein, partial [Terracidiphilus sp.]